MSTVKEMGTDQTSYIMDTLLGSCLMPFGSYAYSGTFVMPGRNTKKDLVIYKMMHKDFGKLC